LKVERPKTCEVEYETTKGTKQTKLGEYYTAMSLEEKYLTEDIFNDYKLYDNE
jgi:hypothetical protein